MPGYQEVLGSLYGAFRLMRLDPSGYAYFNVTAEGFWRSFAAIVLVAPLFYLFALAEYEINSDLTGGTSAAFSDGPRYAGQLMGLVFQWVGFPLAMVFVARMLSVTRNYAGFIIATNWSSVLVMAVLFAPLALFLLGVIGAFWAGTLNALLLLPVLYFRWFVTQTALEVPGMVAVAVVAFEFVLSYGLLDIALKLFN